MASSELGMRSSEIENLKKKKNLEKSSLKRIDINQLPKNLPDFKNSSETKDNALSQWLENWIATDFANGKLKANSLLPRKQDLSLYLGVSVGTVQNAIRYIEDKGYVESKQRIGTLIRDYNEPVTQLRKQTSKREQAIIALKKLIIDNNYLVNTPLPSSRELSKMIGSASNTTRLALEHLASTDIIETKNSRGNKANWVLKQIPSLSPAEIDIDKNDIATDTLVDQIERDLKDYISNNLKVGERLPAHFELSKILKVSLKTVHDGMKRLIEQGILRSRRGRYGTTIMRMPSDDVLQPKPENSIFASAQDASLYNYEKVERHLKTLIRTQYKLGDKLPSMTELSEELDVSTNTIRKALQKLAKQFIVDFSRGRYGGTFITKIPKEDESKAFTWLSINPEHVKAYRSEVTN